MDFRHDQHSFKDSDLITGKVLAAELGVSGAAISKAKDRGRIDTYENSLGKQMFNLERARTQFFGNRNPAHITTATRGQKKIGITDWDAQTLARSRVNRMDDEPTMSPSEARDYAESRAEREFQNARLAKLKADEMEERLVDKIKVSQKVYELASSVKDRLLSIHLKIASAVMGPLEQSLKDAGIGADDARNALSTGHIEVVIGEVCRKQIIDSMRDIIERERDKFAD